MAAKAPNRVAWICCTPLSWSRTAKLSPPKSSRPQLTTDPFSRIAAKASPLAWICCTPLSWSWTAELSPPHLALPQVTTALSPWHHKAKALPVAASCGWSTRAVRHSPSSISASSKVCSKSARTRFLAVISLRCLIPKACWALVLRSCTVEEGRSVKSSACPFGKATFILSIELRRPSILRTLQHISNESLLHTLGPSQARIHDLGTMQTSFDSPYGWWHHDMWYLGGCNASSMLIAATASVSQGHNWLMVWYYDKTIMENTWKQHTGYTNSYEFHKTSRNKLQQKSHLAERPAAHRCRTPTCDGPGESWRFLET